MLDDLIRNLKCQKCLKEFDIPGHARGDFSKDAYLLRNGVRLPLLKQKGFCMTCNAFVWVERLPSHFDVLAQLAEFQQNINDFNGGNTWWGQPLHDFYCSVVKHKNQWLYLMDTRHHPVCLSCGSGDIDLVSEEQLEKRLGDIGIRHGVCDGRIFGSFYKSPYPNIRVSPKRHNWNNPIKFNDYSTRGHKKGSFYYQIYSIMEMEILGIVGSDVQRWTEPEVDEPNSQDFLNWMRAFVHSELESIPLSDSVKKVYRYFPEFMAIIEPQAKEEISKFYKEIIQVSTGKQMMPVSTEKSFWKRFFT